MGDVTGISWTDATHNFWIGCHEVSRACDRCFARNIDARYQYGVKPDDRVPGVAPHWGIDGPRHRTSIAYRRQPHIWNKKAEAVGVPLKVFSNSLSDFFDKAAPQEWREDAYKVWRETPWLRWIILTKRVPNIRKMLPADWGDGYPNVGFMASVCDQEEMNRDAPRLLSVPAAWHGFSIEPQLDRVELPPYLAAFPGSIWIITGGESRQSHKDDGQQGARPYFMIWPELLIRGAAQTSNVSVFVKQTGAMPIGGVAPPRDGHGGDPRGWPPEIRVRQFVPELLDPTGVPRRWRTRSYSIDGAEVPRCDATADLFGTTEGPTT